MSPAGSRNLFVRVALAASIMADMADPTSNQPSRDARVTVRVPPDLAARIDALAAHCGQGRSTFIRTSVALADAHMALEEARALEGLGPLSPEARSRKRLADRRLAEIGKALTPKPLPPLT